MTEAKPQHGVETTRRTRGRPSNADAGAVIERILDAATATFMTHGYEGTSFEQIATAARAGKATIYARYASKEGLFSAVIRRNIERNLTLVADETADAPPDGRLRRLLCATVDRLLSVEAIALTRVVVAEATRFPSLVRAVDQSGRQRSIEMVADVLATDQSQKGRRPDTAAELLLELTFVPLMFRALMGEPLNALRSEIDGRVAQAIVTLRAIEAAAP